MSYVNRDPLGMYGSGTGEGPGPRLMGAGTLMGEDVFNLQDEDLGDIKEIMIDMQSGQIAYAVLSFGGVLGIGDKLFAVPWQAMRLDTENKRFILDCTKRKLENAHGFDKDQWPDMASAEFSSQTHEFYGTQQSMPGQTTSTGSVMGSSSGSIQSDNNLEQNTQTFSNKAGNPSASQNGSVSGDGLSRQGENAGITNIGSGRQ